MELSGLINNFNKGDKDDQLFYLSCLKRVGRIAKVAYSKRPSEKLKQDIIKLKTIIDHYEFR